MTFEWDEAKAEQNLRKHGVTFDYAMRAWLDPYHKEWLDTRQDYGEDRFIRLALIENYLYYVTFTYREDSIRIVSARRATRRERREYEAP